MSVIHHVTSFASPPKCLLIFTDSLNAMAVFNSLHTNETETIHNSPLLGVASVILRTRIDLWVHHIEGKQNIRPDLLSWLLLEEFTSKFPSYRVHLFDPPRDLLLAWWRECFWAHWAGVVVHVPPAHGWSYLPLIIGLTSFRWIPLKNQQQKDTLPVHVITFHSGLTIHSLSTPHLKHCHNTLVTCLNLLVPVQNISQAHVIFYPTSILPSIWTNLTL
jgi:hypothetical protein